MRKILAISGNAAGDGATYVRIVSSLEANGAWRGELALKRSNGEEWQAACNVAPIAAASADQSQIRFVLVVSDVTQLRRAETRLQLATDERAATANALGSLTHRESTEATAQEICERIAGPGIDSAVSKSLTRTAGSP